jgi:hypothetical protein
VKSRVNEYCFVIGNFKGPGSSVGIATGYGLDVPGIECCVTLMECRTIKKVQVGARFFAPVQTGPGAHPASCTMGTGSFPGVKRPGRGADHPPLLAVRSRKSRAIPLLPLWAFGSVTGYLYLSHRQFYLDYIDQLVSRSLRCIKWIPTTVEQAAIST